MTLEYDKNGRHPVVFVMNHHELETVITYKNEPQNLSLFQQNRPITNTTKSWLALQSQLYWVKGLSEVAF